MCVTGSRNRKAVTSIPTRYLGMGGLYLNYTLDSTITSVDVGLLRRPSLALPNNSWLSHKVESHHRRKQNTSRIVSAFFFSFSPTANRVHHGIRRPQR